MTIEFMCSAVKDTLNVWEDGKHIGIIAKTSKWKFIATNYQPSFDPEDLEEIAKKIRQLIHQEFLDTNDIYETNSNGFHMHACNKCHSSTRDTNKLHTIPHTSVCPYYIMSQVDALSGKTPTIFPAG